MSVWNTGSTDHQSRTSTLAMLAVIALVVGLTVVYGPPSPQKAANQLGALEGTLSPIPTETVFPAPQAVEWEGYITRIFVSGGGLEIKSVSAPGGVFQAYMPEGQISPILQGVVRVQGSWRGYTCAYSDVCVPEVDIQTIASQSVELE